MLTTPAAIMAGPAWGQAVWVLAVRILAYARWGDDRIDGHITRRISGHVPE
jgi:hypothetical protein